MKFKISIIALLGLVFLAGCDDKTTRDEPEKTKVQSQPATSTQKKIEEEPKATIEQQNSEQPQPSQQAKSQIDLAMLDGSNFSFKVRDNGIDKQDDKKATLFVFWATWCPPCRAEIPHLNNLNEKFKKELDIIAVLLEKKSAEEIKEFAKRNKISYKIAIGDENFKFEKALGGIMGLPSSVLYAPNGEHANGYVGLVPEEMLESDINKALQ